MQKIGLCLSGGGSRGAYQIGAAKALAELGILERIEAFAGTSIGAVNAALLATLSPEAAFQLWQDVSPDEIKATEGTFRRIMKERMAIFDKGFYNIDPLEKRLRSTLDLAKLKSREVYVTLSDGGSVNESLFGLVRTAFRHFVMNDSKVLYCPLADQKDADVIRMILASCSLPAVFPAVVDHERKYYDGGLYDNIPVHPLAAGGCTDVIILHLWRMDLFDKAAFPGIVFHEIRHAGSLGATLNFDPKRAEILFNYGYEDTIAHFRKQPFHC
ncbi:MAG: patatin-like phospholipase family protein [bacterium]